MARSGAVAVGAQRRADDGGRGHGDGVRIAVWGMTPVKVVGAQTVGVMMGLVRLVVVVGDAKVVAMCLGVSFVFEIVVVVVMIEGVEVVVVVVVVRRGVVMVTVGVKRRDKTTCSIRSDGSGVDCAVVGQEVNVRVRIHGDDLATTGCQTSMRQAGRRASRRGGTRPRAPTAAASMDALMRWRMQESERRCGQTARTRVGRGRGRMIGVGASRGSGCTTRLRQPGWDWARRARPRSRGCFVVCWRRWRRTRNSRGPDGRGGGSDGGEGRRVWPRRLEFWGGGVP